MVGDILLYALMNFKKLSVPEYANAVSDIMHDIDRRIGKNNYTNDHNLEGVFTVEVDNRIAKKVIEILKGNKSVLKYAYAGALEGRYSAFMIAIIDDFLDAREKQKVKKELLYNIYSILSSKQFARDDLKDLKNHVNSKYKGYINEYVYGAGLMLFECYEQDGSEIFNILKKCGHEIVDIGLIEM